MAAQQRLSAEGADAGLGHFLKSLFDAPADQVPGWLAQGGTEWLNGGAEAGAHVAPAAAQPLQQPEASPEPEAPPVDDGLRCLDPAHGAGCTKCVARSAAGALAGQSHPWGSALTTRAGVDLPRRATSWKA